MKYFLSAIFLFCYLQAPCTQTILPGLEGQALLDAIAQNYRPNSVYDYDTARDTLYGDIDRINDSLYCVYTGFGIALTPGADPSSDAFSKGINTEHTWPRSKGAGSGMPESDMHHLFPTLVQANTDRASLPFGEINDNQTDRWFYLAQQTTNPPPVSIRDLYSEVLFNGRFEPREDHKGNVARAMFYFYSVYRPESDAADPNFFPPQIDELCEWHAQDPVDRQELDRTEAIALRQDDKVNPFVVDCNLLMRAYCPSLAPGNCVSGVADDFSSNQPFSILGVGRSAGGQSFIVLNVTENLRLEVDWYDTLGRKVGFESRDWLGEGTFQLNADFKVAGQTVNSNALYIARLKFHTPGGRVYVKSVLVF